MTAGVRLARAWSPGRRMLLGLLITLGAALLLAGVLSIPFLFESPSIRYKFGLDKVLLRAGKLAGLTAGVLLILQLVTAARPIWLDRIFGLPRLMAFHRRNGMALGILAMLHPLLVFAPEELSAIPVAWQYWPEVLGAGLLILLFFMVATAVWRGFLGLEFHRWYCFHLTGAALALGALMVHLLFSSETFETGLPRCLGLGAAAFCLLIWGQRRLKPLWLGRKSFVVRRVQTVGPKAVCVEIAPPAGHGLTFLPGQFVFLRFRCAALTAEEHPFTIASAPGGSPHLQFIIGPSGDWTAGIGQLRAGDRATVDGPYGIFSHLLQPAPGPLIFIAGGIGITPMLSMLRSMHATGAPCRTTLIWSIRTRADVIFADEWRSLQTGLPGLKMRLVATREPGGRHLDAALLLELLGTADPDATVYVCGPPPMMAAVSAALVRIGFKRRQIVCEVFGLG